MVETFRESGPETAVRTGADRRLQVPVRTELPIARREEAAHHPIESLSMAFKNLHHSSSEITRHGPLDQAVPRADLDMRIADNIAKAGLQPNQGTAPLATRALRMLG